MRILGIETSCDETAAAVVENGTKILSSKIATSSEMHAKTGGIIPEQAARQQVRSIIPVIKESIKKSHVSLVKIDAVAVTVGPGLIGSLLVGVETAKTLSYLWDKPIVPINHLVAHIYANWLSLNSKLPKLPALALVVSGGHTDLVLMKKHGELKWLGGTRDDAAGEAFDKCARLLGLPYPGGPAISAAAEKFQIPNSKFQMSMFPRPLIDEDNFDWSFSGLKTAVLREVGGKKITAKDKARFAAEIQEAIVDSLVEKSIKAVRRYKPKSFLLSGGVAANKRLREKFKTRIKSEILQDFHVPDAKLCTDNAAVIASCANFNYHPFNWQKIKADPQLTIAQQV